MPILMLLYLLVPPTSGSLCTTDDYDFDEYRYEEQVPHCRRNVSYDRKDDICHRDGVSDRSEFTVDHIIPLSLGGSNHDDNLWCQHRSLAVTRLEQKVFWMIDRGEVGQDGAIEIILDAKFGG